MSWFATRRPQPPPSSRRRLRLGRTGNGLFARAVELDADAASVHLHIEGKSGYGKSRFFAGLDLGWMASGQAATLMIDPHADSARLILRRLVAEGFFRHPKAFERLIYLDLAAAEDRGLFLAMNPLTRPLPPHVIAAQLVEAAHRAFPETATAPIFATLFPDCILALIAAGQPLTALESLLLDAAFRERCLQTAPLEVRQFFAGYFARLRPSEQVNYAGSIIRRAKVLSQTPVLKHALASPFPAVLDWERIRRQQQHVLVNLGGLPSDARRLIGALVLTDAEQHALRLARQREHERPGKLIVFIDEFHEFVANSEPALAAMLSQCRKFGLFLAMANQDTSQTSERLRGALSNADLRVVFRLERHDAEHYAGILGSVNPYAVKYEVADSRVRDSRAPVFLSLNEQWEQQVQRIMHLPRQHALIKLPSGEVVAVRTPSFPDPVVDEAELAAIEQRYLDRYFQPPAEADPDPSPPPPSPAPSSRRFADDEAVADD